MSHHSDSWKRTRADQEQSTDTWFPFFPRSRTCCPLASLQDSLLAYAEVHSALPCPSPSSSPEPEQTALANRMTWEKRLEANLARE